MAFKKTLLSIAAMGILSIAGCSAPSKDVSPVELERWKKIQKFTPSSIEDIKTLVVKDIAYEDEKHDFWSSARKTFMEAKEDCDGKAILGSYLAEKLGYPPELLLVHTGELYPKDQHALTLLEEKRNGQVYYGAIDDRVVIKPDCCSLDKLVYEINQARKPNELPYLCYKVYDLNKKNPKWRTANGDIKNFLEDILGLLSFKAIDLEKIKEY
jgi:hypothetical protein